MFVVCVTVKVKPEFVDAFVEASKLNQAGSRQEPGNVRWDLLQSEDEPTHFVLYEVYKTKEDFPIHQQTPHFLKWRETVAPMMAEPRTRVNLRSIAPADEHWNK